jgi:NAD(P)-dependent dehydrogenase (short-subunit alcohol dehydrogenase family)
VDLYGTSMLLEEFGAVIAEGGSGVVISSQSGYRMPALTAEQDALLATAPAEELLKLDFIKDVKDTLHAYQMSKRCNSLRVRGEAVKWAKRGARINAISPGIIVTPLANDELHGERADFYQAMLKKMPAGRAGTPDEVAALAALIMGPEGGFITGSDFLIDGGATASYFYGELARAGEGRRR